MRQSAVSTEPRSAPASRAEHPPRGAESCLHPSSTREASRDERMTPKRVFPGMLAVLEDCRRFGLCGLFTKPPLEFGPGGWFDNPLLDASLNCGRRWRHGSPFTTRNSYRSDPHLAGGAQRYFSRRALVVRHKRVCARDEGRAPPAACRPRSCASPLSRTRRAGVAVAAACETPESRGRHPVSASERAARTKHWRGPRPHTSVDEVFVGIRGRADVRGSRPGDTYGRWTCTR